jgi:hypothetical protein
MVYNSLLAFSAADAAINTDWSSRKEYSEQSFNYYDQAASELRKRIGEIDQRRSQGKNPNTMPILYTVFLLAAFGVSLRNHSSLSSLVNKHRYVRIARRRFG